MINLMVIILYNSCIKILILFYIILVKPQQRVWFTERIDVESSETVSEPTRGVWFPSRVQPVRHQVIRSACRKHSTESLPQNGRMNSFRSVLHKPNRSKSPPDTTSSGAMPDQSMLHMIIPQSKHAINRLTPRIEK